MGFPEMNIELLDEVRDFLVNNQDRWHQQAYGILAKEVDDYLDEVHGKYERDEISSAEFHEIIGQPVPTSRGTRACFAGWTLLNNGYQMTMSAQFVDPEGKLRDPDYAAQELLGLTWTEAEALFEGSNSMADIDKVIAKIKADFYRKES